MVSVAAEQLDAPIMVERSRKNTIPAGTLTAADLAASSMTHMQQVQHAPSHGGQNPATMPVQPMDPQTLLFVEGVAAIKALAKSPKNRGPVFAGVASGLVAGIVTAVLSVFVHDQTTRGTVSDRLDAQDKRLGTVIVVMEGMLDEGEDDMAWMESALEAGFAGRQLPPRGASRRKELRRTLSRQ